MTIIEEFTAIVEEDKHPEIIPFLKQLDNWQKTMLQPVIKKLAKHYTGFVQIPGTSTSQTRATGMQLKIISIAAFVCLNQKDFEQAPAYGVINREKLNTILPWYCPEWFNSYVDKFALKDYVGNYFDYDWYMELVEQGYLSPNKFLIAKILPEFIFKRNKKGHNYTFLPRNLLKRPITLQEHIWYLFDEATNLHGAENYKHFDDGSADGRWHQVFKMYSDDSRIDRKRLLKEAVTAGAKNFNQSLTNWFVDLFVYLKPTNDELLSLHNELLNLFNGSNSKPVNVALKYFKDLALNANFAVDSFLDHVHIVLTANSKTNVTTTLLIFDKLAKQYPERQEQICIITTQALMHQDEALQVKAAKIISKFCTTPSAELKQAIANYYSGLFSEVKSLLKAFDNEVADTAEEPQTVDESEKNKSTVAIIPPATFDEFVFLASQAFDGNEPYHFDLLPAAVLKFQTEITAENIAKLAPAFQRAYKTITGNFTSSMGYLDHMLATFFVDYGRLLVKFYPKEAQAISLMHQAFQKKEDEKKVQWPGYDSTIDSIKEWDIYTHSPGYIPHKLILINAHLLIENKLNLPLLSTPTHAPCWIDPNALIDRLSQYHSAKILPGEMDLQIAIARCMAFEKEAAQKLASQKLSGEYFELIDFVLGGKYYPKENYKLKTAWLVAALTREQSEVDKSWFRYSSLTDQFLLGAIRWESKVENYTWQKYNYQTGKDEEAAGSHKIIEFNFEEKEKKRLVVKGTLNQLFKTSEKPEKSLYDYTLLKFESITAEHKDIQRLLYLNPKHTDVLLAYVVAKAYKYLDFFSEDDKKLVNNTLEALVTLNAPHGIITQLFIATSMLSNDKTIRNYAAEIWINGVKYNSLSSELIGQMIGKHETIELAPLKRFTDLILSNLYQISPHHNLALQQLIEGCIVNMNDKPINNTKKLLEIYAEVLDTNKSIINNIAVITKLKEWGKLDSLAKLVTKLSKH